MNNYKARWCSINDWALLQLNLLTPSTDHFPGMSNNSLSRTRAGAHARSRSVRIFLRVFAVWIHACLLTRTDDVTDAHLSVLPGEAEVAIRHHWFAARDDGRGERRGRGLRGACNRGLSGSSKYLYCMMICASKRRRCVRASMCVYGEEEGWERERERERGEEETSSHPVINIIPRR